ncbi:uncharacterized protein LOC114751577 [Neltuma alba]|uniref:uncharacterized protein LOC114751577 n=1 Tax=Neltuma alba TaxID=207710 RepID=UPI0010A55E6D|nr:uncharacterized protein LOC114751577 [Prosopis alba]XP_028796065.1 uncharacterized protein LOC114751577 [Prosopis alba]XP_028796066.1 uncharacterized protein LOC114751577 [Prosopis alba]XP_028796067.1 uncharacterized protein LOC114751577 [Prosopis alba]XP_028796068.1 uncharacterized protein LOC114751577 [Prosopis alba]XP_028796069.1 uncharacterized protein LOC114751577 [Prosopis alba]XP_028796070.1 uncharacterized protein LOC114751577 [Prosopis alba]
MDKESLRSNNNINNNPKDKSGLAGADASSLLLRGGSDSIRQAASTTTTTTSDLLLGWGNRKRLRCMKIQVKDDSSATVQRTTVRVDRRVVKDPPNHSTPPVPNGAITHNHSNRYPNLRQRSSSPQQPPPRILRNSETSSAMRGQSNGGVRGIASPDRGAHDKRGSHHNHHHHHHDNNKSAASSDTAHDSKKGGSPSGSGDVAPPVWPPKFVIALTNKEKEEDFLAIKGSKLPQRPKKRAKFIQRTLNLVSPGAWLCDLTLERYEVREKKISKKRPRGLKAMGTMDSDSE